MYFLSSRELSILIWSTFILLYSLKDNEVRKSIFYLIIEFFNKKLIFFWVLYILNIILITYFFYLLPIWNNVFFKDIIIWSLFSGCSYYINSISIKYDYTYIKYLIRSNLKLVLFWEYISSNITFNIFIELLIISIGTMLITLIDFSKRNKDYEYTYIFLSWVLNILSAIFIIHIIELIILYFRNLLLVNNIISFIIPLFYLILSLPFFYIVKLYVEYEELFIKIKCICSINSYRVRYIKIIMACNLSIRRILKFKKYYLYRIYSSMSDIEFNNLIIDFKLNIIK